MKHSHSARIILAILGLVCLPELRLTAQTNPSRYRVIAFSTASSDQGHISFVQEARRWFPKAADERGFAFESTTNWGNLNRAFLAKYDVVMFLDTRPDKPAQREAFREYMENGGAWMGFHFAAFALTPSQFPQNWDWYHHEFLGAGSYAGNTWRPTSAILKVEDPRHPAMLDLPATFVASPNEWYKWSADLRTNRHIRILASIDPASFPLGTGPKAHEIWHDGYHPVVWTNEKYRMIYFNMGHNDIAQEEHTNPERSFTFGNEVQNTLVLNALEWLGAGRKSPPPEVPDFGPNVLVMDPSMPNLQGRIDAIFQQQERSQFGTNRHAYLFKPGKYELDVQLGFYMQVLGLGESPDEVSITGAVRSKARWLGGNNATCNFWRCVENLSVTPTEDEKVNLWAVSQATALRRVHVKGDLNLWDGGWSSGGFLADCKIDGQVNSGSQQQWFSRNAAWGSWTGANWNMVFVGVANPPAGRWPEPPYTVIDRTPVIREKPYLFLDEAGRYFIRVPPLAREGTPGITWSEATPAGEVLPIEQCHLARPDRDNAASLNAALSGGKHLLFTPGIYHLEDGIRVTRPDTVVLGLGYPTLLVDNGTPAMVISDVEGVKVGGLLLEAGARKSTTLLQVGESGSTNTHAANPVFLWDLFCRVGGAQAGQSDCMVIINSPDVVGDNLWLWRADHGRGAGWTSNPNKNGLIVNGDNVTLYGLFVEHTQEYQTIWNGNGGRVYFYQSELPYDPPSQDAWRHGDVRGFASYKVADSVTTHAAWGLGVYCVFNDAPVVCENAIETPTAPGVRMHHLVTIRLGGQPNSGINHVINGYGAPVITTRKAIVD